MDNITIDSFSDRLGLESSEGFECNHTEVHCRETNSSYMYIVNGNIDGWVISSNGTKTLTATKEWIDRTQELINEANEQINTFDRLSSAVSCALVTILEQVLADMKDN